MQPKRAGYALVESISRIGTNAKNYTINRGEAMSEYRLGIIKTIPPPYAFHKAIRDLFKTNNKNQKYMTKEKLITKQQLKIQRYKSILKKDIKIAMDIKGKFYSIGAPLNDNKLQFNKEQQKWCCEVMELVEQILE